MRSMSRSEEDLLPELGAELRDLVDVAAVHRVHLGELPRVGRQHPVQEVPVREFAVLQVVPVPVLGEIEDGLDAPVVEQRREDGSDGGVLRQDGDITSPDREVRSVERQRHSSCIPHQVEALVVSVLPSDVHGGVEVDARLLPDVQELVCLAVGRDGVNGLHESHGGEPRDLLLEDVVHGADDPDVLLVDLHGDVELVHGPGNLEGGDPLADLADPSGVAPAELHVVHVDLGAEDIAERSIDPLREVDPCVLVERGGDVRRKEPGDVPECILGTGHELHGLGIGLLEQVVGGAVGLQEGHDPLHGVPCGGLVPS